MRSGTHHMESVLYNSPCNHSNLGTLHFFAIFPSSHKSSVVVIDTAVETGLILATFLTFILKSPLALLLSNVLIGLRPNYPTKDALATFVNLVIGLSEVTLFLGVTQ